MRDERLGTVLWRGRFLILLTVVASVALAVLASSMSEKVYEGRALLRINQPEAGASGDAYNAQQASQSFANTYATMLNSRSFLERVAPRVADGRYPADALQGRVGAEALLDTSLVSLSVTGESPEVTQRLAGDIAREFIDALKEDSRALLNEQQQAIESRITSLTQQIRRARNSPENTDSIESLQLARNALTEQLASALALNLSRNVDVSLTGPPTASSSPVSPRPRLNIAAGLLLGALVGCALAWLRMRVDTTLQSPEEAQETLKARVLASVPLRRRWKWDDWAIRNAFDRLHTNVIPLAREHDVKAIVVTSPNEGDGKSTTARGLAEAAARAGTDVLLVDGDLRQRRLTTDLAGEEIPGLSDAILHGYVPLILSPTDVMPFSFLSAGQAVTNPAGLLHSPEAGKLLDRARGHYDLVVIDTPPGNAVPDALIFAGLTDAVIVVGRVGRTKRTALTDLASALSGRALRSLGIVLFESRPDASTYAETESSGPARKRPLRA